MKKSFTLLIALLLTVLGATQARADYYLVGDSYGWTAPNNYKFTVNPSNSNEYVLTEITLIPGDQIKVTNPDTNQWYPSGANYTVPEKYAGLVSIYFSPYYRNDWEQFGGYFWIEVIQSQFIVNTVNIAGLNGDWQPNLNNYAMTEVLDNIWELTYENLPAGSQEMKFTVNHSWEVNFGGNFSDFGIATNAYRDGDNIAFSLNDAADVIFRLDLTNYDPSTKEGATFTISVINDLTLLNEGDNTEILSQYNGKPANVTLLDRTLYKDTYWNTLCLPFKVDLTEASSPLYDAEVMGLAEASVEGTTLTLTFQEVNDMMVAGTPYLVKWNSGSDIENPVFNNVIIDSNLSASNENVSFVGIFSSTTLPANDKTNLFLGADNSLFYPNTDVTLGAFRGYFHINNESLAKMIDDAVINFYDQAPTSIRYALSQNEQTANQGWYTLSGQRLGAKPAKAGIYVVNGKKIIIK